MEKESRIVLFRGRIGYLPTYSNPDLSSDFYSVHGKDFVTTRVFKDEIKFLYPINNELVDDYNFENIINSLMYLKD